MVASPCRILSVCSGIGGIDLGLKLAIPNATTVCYVEREGYAAATLVQRMAEKTLDSAPIWDCLKSFPIPLFLGRVDIAVGGIPCQPYSAAGEERGGADERDLWPDMLRILREVGAQALFLENVDRFISNPDGLARVLRQIAPLGFDAEWGVYSCGQLGAPHVRKRLFFLAYTSRFKQWLKSRRWFRSSRSGQALAPDTGETLPYSANQQLQPTPQPNGGQSQRDCSEVANTQSQPEPGSRQAEGRELETQLEGNGCQLVNAESSRLEAGGHSREKHSQLIRPSFWPPGPDPEAWRGIDPRIRPAVPKPEFCGVDARPPAWVVDANTYRSDRLRGLGNLASSAVVAVAWTDLVARVLRG